MKEAVVPRPKMRSSVTDDGSINKKTIGEKNVSLIKK